MALTSLIRLIVSFHLSTSDFVCSYATSLSRRACDRCGKGAGSAPVLLDEANGFTEVFSSRKADVLEVDGAIKSSRLSFTVPVEGVTIKAFRQHSRG